MMKTALPSLRREPCISTSRACTTIIATGPMSCGRSVSGRWCPCCCCRPASRRRGCWNRLSERMRLWRCLPFIFSACSWHWSGLPRSTKMAKIHKSAGEQNRSLLCCAVLCYNRTKTDETGERTCSEIHRSTCADRWILPARSHSLAGTRRSPLPAMAAGTAAVGGRISSSPGLIYGGSQPVSVCRPAL